MILQYKEDRNEKIILKYTELMNKELTTVQIEDVVHIVCEFYEIHPRNVYMANRVPDVVWARCIICFICRNILTKSYSYKEIETHLNMSHPSARGNCLKIESFYKQSTIIKDTVDSIMIKLNEFMVILSC